MHSSLPPVGRIAKNVLNIPRKTPSMTQVSLLLTYRCTQQCRQCYAPQIQTKNTHMRLEDVDAILSAVAGYGTLGVTLSGGDPMLHPHLDECARLVKSRGFLRTHMLSNLYGPDELVDRLIDTTLRHRFSVSCSFDGFDELADELRGAPNVSQTVERNMRRLDKANKRLKRPVLTGVNITLNARNLTQLPRMLDLIAELGWKANVDLYRWSSERQNEVNDLKLSPNDELKQALDLARSHPNVFTPNWLLEGFIDFLEGDYPKRCPYLDFPSFGSKFFINPDGDVEVCIGACVGNLLRDRPEDIFTSAEWWRKMREFKACPGCWNTCYTLAAGLFQEKRPDDIIKMARLTFPRVFGKKGAQQQPRPSR